MSETRVQVSLIMKKTLSLLGLLFIGLTLLANPSTGILAATDTEPVVLAEPTTTISGDPPDVYPGEISDNEAGDTTTTTASTTTTTQLDLVNSFAVVGSVEASRFGSFQVEVSFEGGVIVGVEVLQLPTDRKSNAINNTAVPLYEEAVIEAQSADIDVISGATVTWNNYTESLQSALDEAGV